MRDKVQRGRIVYIRPEKHKQLIPDDVPAKLGKRPWLVVQRDFANASSDYTIVLSLTTAGAAEKKSKGTDVFMPKGLGLANENCFADCATPHTIRDKDIVNVFDGNYYNCGNVMEEIDHALRIAMDLDPDGLYPPP